MVNARVRRPFEQFFVRIERLLTSQPRVKVLLLSRHITDFMSLMLMVECAKIFVRRRRSLMRGHGRRQSSSNITVNVPVFG